MKNIFKRFKKTTATATATKWIVSYADSVVGYGERMETFTNEIEARNYLEALKERNTDSTIDFFMYEA